MEKNVAENSCKQFAKNRLFWNAFGCITMRECYGLQAMFKMLAVIIPPLRWFRKAVWTRWKNQTVSHSFLFTILVCLVGFLFLQFSFYVLYLCLFFLFLSFCKHSTDTRFFHFHYELGNISTITLVVGAYCRLLCAYMRMRYFSRLNQCNAFR